MCSFYTITTLKCLNCCTHPADVNPFIEISCKRREMNYSVKLDDMWSTNLADLSSGVFTSHPLLSLSFLPRCLCLSRPPSPSLSLLPDYYISGANIMNNVGFFFFFFFPFFSFFFACCDLAFGPPRQTGRLFLEPGPWQEELEMRE